MSAMKEEFINTLNEDLDGQELQNTFGGKEFRITDQRGATWALRKIRQARDRANEAAATADAEIAIITEWLAKTSADSAFTIKRMEAYLRDYMLQLQAADPKLKSLKLPGGTLKTVTRQKYDYKDEEIMAWARVNLPEAITTKIVDSLAKTVIKTHFEDTGEDVPGLTVSTETSFSVKIEEGEQTNE